VCDNNSLPNIFRIFHVVQGKPLQSEFDVGESAIYVPGIDESKTFLEITVVYFAAAQLAASSSVREPLSLPYKLALVLFRQSRGLEALAMRGLS
jgi:hypothetical protein